MSTDHMDEGAPRYFAAYIEASKDGTVFQTVVFPPTPDMPRTQRTIERTIAEDAGGKKRWKWASLGAGAGGTLLGPRLERFEKTGWKIEQPVVVEYPHNENGLKAHAEVDKSSTPYRVLRWLDRRCEELGRAGVQRG